MCIEQWYNITYLYPHVKSWGKKVKDIWSTYDRSFTSSKGPYRDMNPIWDMTLIGDLTLIWDRTLIWDKTNLRQDSSLRQDSDLGQDSNFRQNSKLRSDSNLKQDYNMRQDFNLRQDSDLTQLLISYCKACNRFWSFFFFIYFKLEGEEWSSHSAMREGFFFIFFYFYFFYLHYVSIPSQINTRIRWR